MTVETPPGQVVYLPADVDYQETVALMLRGWSEVSVERVVRDGGPVWRITGRWMRP